MRKPGQHFFGADISPDLWDTYERWASGRGKIERRQLQRALFRLFLAAPESLKLAALYGKDGKRAEDALRAGLRAIIREVLREETGGLYEREKPQ